MWSRGPQEAELAYKAFLGQGPPACGLQALGGAGKILEGSLPFTDLGLYLEEMLQDPGDLGEEEEGEALVGNFEKGL